MACEWHSAPLGELISYIGKGVAPKYINDGPDATMVLGQKCVRNQALQYEQARFHNSAEKAVNPDKEVRKGDILVNATGVGSAGRVAQVMADPSRQCITDGHVITLRAKDINPFYLGYFVKSKQNTIELMAEGSTGQTEMNRQRLQNEIIVTFPESKDLQKRIAEYGLAIDKKIAVNNQLNDYLEQCLLARYDHLFRGAGTYNGTISDIGDVVGGATPSKKRPEYYCHEGIGWITPKDLSNTTNKFVAHGADDITRVGFDSCSIKKLPAGTVLFSSRAPIGYIAIASDEVTTNQGFKSIVPHKEIGTAFVYCFLVRNKDRIADAGSGTTFPEVSGKTMAGIELTLPNINLCAKFEEWASPLLEEQRHLEDENRQLEDLRDTLLPKLMSGEIDVSKVDLTQLTNNHLADC